MDCPWCECKSERQESLYTPTERRKIALIEKLIDNALDAIYKLDDDAEARIFGPEPQARGTEYRQSSQVKQQENWTSQNSSKSTPYLKKNQ